MFNAFSEENLANLNKHFNQQVGGVKAIQRGGKFDFYSAGKMYPHGTRAPMGGRPGDGYVMYEGMDADGIDSVNVLFNHAEASDRFYIVTKLT